MAESKLAGLIGRPLDRVDGRLKVTGKSARMPMNTRRRAPPPMASSFPQRSARGASSRSTCVTHERAPGVLLVLTKDNAPPQTPWGPVDLPDRFARAEPALNTDEVRYFGFPVAFVVAETFEQATAAAALVRVRYAALPGDYDLHAAGPHAENPGRISGGAAADSAVGDFEAAFADAPVKIEAIYTTPYQHQAPMEPHATMAVWEGQMLTVHTSAQLTTSPQEGLARTFNIRKEDVRIITRYVGGGFGSKLPYYVDATLAAIGARMLRRPVKVAMTRPQLFHMTTHRTASEQRLRLGADRDGRLTAYGQDALVQCARFDAFTEPVCVAARMLYAAPNRLTRHRLAKLDLPRSRFDARPGRRDRSAGARMRDGRAGRGPRASIRWSCACATIPRSIRSSTSRFPRAISPKRCAKAPPASAGTSASQSRPASATGVGSSASASPRRSAATCCSSATRACASGERRPADGRTGDDRHRHRHLHDPDARLPPRRWSCRSTASPFASATPAFLRPPARAAPLERRHPARRFLPPAASSRPGCPPGSRKPKGSVTPAELDSELRACRLRRAFRGSRRASGHRRGARSAHARRVRGRPHPQCQDRALADDRRDDLGHRRRR